MSEMIIRQARESDIDEITRLDQLCFSAPWSRESFRQEIMKNGMALYLVAELPQSGELVGYAGIWAILDEGHITNVAVHPEYRRRHIGEALVKVLLEEASASGIRQFTLEARVSNEPAIRLYRKFGFREAGVRKGYYEDNNEDALIMWAEATAPDGAEATEK